MRAPRPAGALRPVNRRTPMELFTLSLLNGLSYGLLLFMLSSGLTLILGLMGVLNFAHASFYMLGAYLGWSLAGRIGFWPALVLAPLAVGGLGALFERACLRRVHRQGHVAELLVSFGLSYVIVEVVQLAWGRSPLVFEPPALLQGPAFTLVHSGGALPGLVLGAAPAELCRAAAQAAAGGGCTSFPATRAFTVLVALAMFALLGAIFARTRLGLVIQAALTHPRMVEALGHDLPRIQMLVFGAGAALAGLAGVVGGISFVTEPAMAATLGSLIFVVIVVGGLGSLTGAFLASLGIGLLQTFAVSLDRTLGELATLAGWAAPPHAGARALLDLSLAQLAPVLPYLLMVAVLVLRPRGLLGTREG